MVDLGFGKVNLPEGWVVNASINLVGPADTELPGGRQAKQPMYPNVNLTVAEHENDDSAASTEAMRDEHLTKLESQLPKFRLIEKGELQRDDGVALPSLTYTFAPQPRLVVKQVQTLERRHKRVYYLTATAPAATFDRNWESLKRVMCSYQPPVDG